MTEKELVERISLARTMANLSARELSLKADVNGAYISRLETANSTRTDNVENVKAPNDKSFNPSISTMLKLIEACGMTEEEFFYHNILDYKKDKQILDLLAKCKNEKIKDAVISILENS